MQPGIVITGSVIPSYSTERSDRVERDKHNRLFQRSIRTTYRNQP